MKDIFIKTNEFSDDELHKINKYTGDDYRSNDIMSIESLFVIVQNLIGKCELLEEELEDKGQVEPDYYDEWHDRKMCEE